MRNTLALILLPICLSACTPPSSPPAPQTEPKADALAARVAALEEKLEAVNQGSLQDIARIYKLETRYHEAQFDPSEPKFQRIDTNVGSFAVSVDDVSPFGDGVKVKISLGNLSSASASGVTLHLTYGPRQVESEDPKVNLAWLNKLKSKDAEITERLLPGSWNPVSIVLPGIDPKEFGYISISMDATTISLRKN